MPGQIAVARRISKRHGRAGEARFLERGVLIVAAL
jgi:hypothetical protein